MQPIATNQELQRSERSFRRVFLNVNLATPFVPRLDARLLLYPIDYTILDARQYDAVAAAARQSGARDAYFAGFGGEDRGWRGTYSHGVVSLANYDDYRDANTMGALEHFLFGREGDWGLVTSDGQYALVAGDRAFIDALVTALGYDQEHAVRAFVTDWRKAAEAGANVAWVPKLLDHVLGPERGQKSWPEPR